MKFSQLNEISSPSDLKKLSTPQLDELCHEIREFLIESISKTGGHLSSNLGIVELTVALHKVFDCPEDKIIFDVGHQCYTHKILTGRKDKFDNLRKMNGIAGFPKPTESEYDGFIAGHASTSVSSAFGIAQAMAIKGEKNYAIAVVGDGALTGGEVYEAMNNAGQSKIRLIVILNDNEMSISKNVGALSKYLSHIRSGKEYLAIKKSARGIIENIPFCGRFLAKMIRSSKSAIKSVLYQSTFFEQMGYKYYGPVNGHNLPELMRILETAKEDNSPVFIHVETLKGKGYNFAEENPGVYHAISKFERNRKVEVKNSLDCYSNTIGEELVRLAHENDKICAITAAMKDGTGLLEFSATFKERFFDVGIAEGHAVTFAGGLASQGMLPVFCVYSTFLQRGYDQIIHDLSIDNKHVILCVDRAGIVGEDGETHQGIFDVAFLSNIPNITIYSPEGYEETRLCLQKAVSDTGVQCIRYPRGADMSTHKFAANLNFSYQKKSNKRVLVSYGRVFSNCYNASLDIDISLLKLTKIMPIDLKVIELLLGYDEVYFVEEGIQIGGVAQLIGAILMQNNFKGSYKVKAIDNQFVEHASVEQLLELLKLDKISIKTWIEG